MSDQFKPSVVHDPPVVQAAQTEKSRHLNQPNNLWFPTRNGGQKHFDWTSVASADGFVYVAPSLILHYIDSYRYSPPVAFQEAVISYPPMRSMEYLKAILKNGPKGIVTK